MLFSKLVGRYAYVGSPLACLSTISLVWSIGFAFDSALLDSTLAPFLIIFSMCIITLSHTRTFADSMKSGILLFIIANPIEIRRYFFHKTLACFVYGVLPLTFLSSVLILFFKNGGDTLHYFLHFFMTHFLSCASTLCLTLLLSALMTQYKHPQLQGLFLVWPLLIPSLILSLITLRQEPHCDSLSTIYLNLALFMVYLGTTMLLTPFLLLSSVDE